MIRQLCVLLHQHVGEVDGTLHPGKGYPDLHFPHQLRGREGAHGRRGLLGGGVGIVGLWLWNGNVGMVGLWSSTRWRWSGLGGRFEQAVVKVVGPL